MDRSTLEWYELLARGLLWAAGIVLLLSLIGAVVIAGSDNALPGFEMVERQGRGIAALASLGGGLTAAGLLGGLGAILRMLIADRFERLGPAPEDASEERSDRQPELFDAVDEGDGDADSSGNRGPVKRESKRRTSKKRPSERVDPEASASARSRARTTATDDE